MAQARSETESTPVPEETPVAKQPTPLTKRTATIGDLLGKKARTDVIPVPLTQEDGSVVELTVTLKALSSRAYDALEAKHQPTRDQKDKGMVHNIDTFAPALISACALVPEISLEQATELYESDQWSSGEIGGLFFAAQRLCNAGLDASFTAAG